MKGGKMKKIEDVYKEYANIIYKYVYSLSNNKDIAEEITQETFLIAVENIKKFRGECKISTWLCQISKYIWYRKIKKEKSKKEISLESLQSTLIVDDSLEDDICKKENRIQLFKKLQELDEETRNVMYLRIFGNFEYSEIAEIMNKTSNWARVVFFRGKQKLKEELEK